MKLFSLCIGYVISVLLCCSCSTAKAGATAAPAAVASLFPGQREAKLPPKAPPQAALPEFSQEQSDNYRRALLLLQTMEMLRNNYVDGKKVTYEELFNHAMQGMVSALDPYSAYELPKEHLSRQIKRKGELVGIGAAVVKPDGKPVILIRILPGTPAEAAGLKTTDQIIAIDGKNVLPLNLAGALDKLRGEAGSKVKLQIRRGKQEFPLTITRKIVRTNSVVPGSVKLIEDKIGYIKLKEFAANSGNEVASALKKLRSLGAKAIILDLRFNPGGLVQAAVEIASLFLPGNSIIFKATSRKKNAVQQVKALKNKTIDTKIPLVILVNAFSASASEILTGALQDHKRAKVLGSRTFGKGTILSVVPVPGGGAVRFASAYYVTPGGRIIEKKGIMPDIEVRISSAEVLRLSSQTLRYPGVISPPFKGAFKDRQLAKAVEVLRKQIKQKAPQK